MNTSRAELVKELRQRGIKDDAVIAALEAVPREAFVPNHLTSQAYANTPLTIGHGQTISQPLVVAMMTELLGVKPNQKILEIGTGSGYQTAILAQMGADVYSVERIPELAAKAAHTLDRLGFSVHLKTDDGNQGWPAAAPFDGIIVTAAPAQLPTQLVEQLADGGRMVIPVGLESNQNLELIRKKDGKIIREVCSPVRFVPLI